MLGNVPNVNIQDMTPTQYKTHLKLKIKDMNEKQRIHYNNLRVRLHRKNKKKDDYIKYGRAKKQ